MAYHLIMGLEVHVQLNTKTKLFCRCLNEYVPSEPNKNICVFCTGQPGALPLLNKEAVRKAIVFGVAIGAKIPENTRWDRKNYFYPDLPTGYQISQYDNPIVEGGKIEFYVESDGGKSSKKHSINLTRAHLEADAGKLLHVGDKTLVDFNRSGCPLIEIVSEPELRSAAEAMAYVSELQLLVRTLAISDADMEKGQMRFDCNISLQTDEEFESGKLPGYRVEMKNINSIRALGRAIEAETIRQRELLEKGEMPVQETRGWRDDLNKSMSQRGKEQAHDYRYFPEPDLQILEIKPSDLPDIASLPILPNFKREEFLGLGLNLQTANTFVTQAEVGELFNKAVLNMDLPQNLVKTVANIVTTNLIALAAKLEKPIADISTPEQLLDLASLYADKKINNQGVIKALELLNSSPEKKVQAVVEAEGLLQLSDETALEGFVDNVIKMNPTVVEQYKSGKVQVIGFLVGACMKQSLGQGNPEAFKRLLLVKLG